jgi:hypothetical protein
VGKREKREKCEGEAERERERLKYRAGKKYLLLFKP